MVQANIRGHRHDSPPQPYWRGKRPNQTPPTPPPHPTATDREKVRRSVGIQLQNQHGIVAGHVYQTKINEYFLVPIQEEALYQNIATSQNFRKCSRPVQVREPVGTRTPQPCTRSFARTNCRVSTRPPLPSSDHHHHHQQQWYNGKYTDKPNFHHNFFYPLQQPSHDPSATKKSNRRKGNTPGPRSTPTRPANCIGY